MAAARIDSATEESLSYCRHRLERPNICALPHLHCTTIERARSVPEVFDTPVVLVPRAGRESAAVAWKLGFWQQLCPGERCRFRTRWPSHELDDDNIEWELKSAGMEDGLIVKQHTASAEGVVMEGAFIEFLEYLAAVEEGDPECLPEQSLAFPRLQLAGWCPFKTIARELFDANLHQLGPPGLEARYALPEDSGAIADLTPRWVEHFASIFEEVPGQHLPQFYQVHVAPPGAVTRLHRENHDAHVWFQQIEGQRLFIAFSPEDLDEGFLYAYEGGGFLAWPEGYAEAISEVDPLFPQMRRHPLFLEARAQIALLSEGKTLVLPHGWWWYSVVTQGPSITLHHQFWSFKNRLGFVKALWAPFEGPNVHAAAREEVRSRFSELRQCLLEDDGRSKLEL